MLGTSAPPDLSGDARRLRMERDRPRLFLSAAVFTIPVSVAIVPSLVGEAVAFLQSIASEIDEGPGSRAAANEAPMTQPCLQRTEVLERLRMA